MRRKKYRYNPLKAPKPKEWLAMDEDRRIALVEDYHRKEGIQMPNVRAHAVFHTIIENQAALGDKTPVAEAIRRLRNEGLDRHDALHAVASIFAKYFYNTFKGEKTHGEAVKEAYYEEVRGLTKQQWYEEFGPE